MRIAFVVADVAHQTSTFGTLYLARAALRRGHDARFVGVDDLTFAPDHRILATTVRPPASMYATTSALASALAGTAALQEEEDLSAFDVIFLRYNPRRDAMRVQGHGASTSKMNPAVEFGWRLRLSGSLVVNDPEGLQRAGGRMFLSGLPHEIRPRTLITRSNEAVKVFLKTLEGPAIVKPLAGGGMNNVFYVEKRRNPNLNQILSAVKRCGYLIVQEYVREARAGDLRLLLLAGDPIRSGQRVAIYRRTRIEDPSAIHSGGIRTERKPCSFGPKEQRIVDLVRDRLKAEGLYFISMDIASGLLLELNVHTPGGLHANQELYGLDVGEIVVRDLERRVQDRARRGKAAPQQVL